MELLNTMSDWVRVSFGTVEEKYLVRRGKLLYKYHPQWNYTNEEIEKSKDLLKRDGATICIPPSLDLAQRFAGSEDSSGAFPKVLYNLGKTAYQNDQTESDFLEMIRGLKLGGIMICDLNTRQMQMAFTDQDKKDFILSDPLKDVVRNAGDAKITFIFFHATAGIFQIEVKRARNRRSFTDEVKRAREKLSRGNLKRLFMGFCEFVSDENSAELWKRYYGGGLIYASIDAKCINTPENRDWLQWGECKTFEDWGDCEVILGEEKLQAFWANVAHRRKFSRNFFKELIFRKFVTFLCGYRPDWFISPVQGALKTHWNIFSSPINTLNYYRPDANAILVADYLKTLTFLQDTDIDLGDEYRGICLTGEQIDAIGSFDADGNFSPNKQLILGPPGSGKSLILMLKIFILGQLQSRHRITLYYTSHCVDHRKKVMDFVSRNQNKFCRNVEREENILSDKSPPGDVIVDEAPTDWNKFAYENQKIVSVVLTGQIANVTENDHADKRLKVILAKFKSCGFTITQLKNNFRSPQQVQKFFFRFNEEEHRKEWHSAHFFDGVRVETYALDDPIAMMKAVTSRIRRLMNVDGVKPEDIGVFLPQAFAPPREFSKLGKVSTHSDELRSLQMMAMVLVQPFANEMAFLLSRAGAHLIVFATEDRWKEIRFHFKHRRASSLNYDAIAAIRDLK